MKVFSYDIIAKPEPGENPITPQYVSIHEPDSDSLRRRLYIEDSEGRHVVLCGEEIGRLYRHIKPALAG